MAREVTHVVESDPDSSPKRGGFFSFLKELPILIGLALGIALIIKAFLIQAFFIPSGSMQPTLEIKDRVLVNKLTYRFGEPERGDVVVFKEPLGDPCARTPGPGFTPDPACDRNIVEGAWNWFAELFGIPTTDLANKDYIKRVIALPGETFSMQDGDVYIDGKKTEFPNQFGVSGPQNDDTDWDPVKIPKDHYFVLGDNRGNSSDSRVFGPIGRDKIIGRAFVIIWPPNRFGGL